MNNPYNILGISKTATLEDIKKAYRKLAMLYHPDRNPGDKVAEDRFKEVQTAYDDLNDPVKKSRYDATSSTSTASGSPFNGIWDSVFGHPPPQQERGRNIQITIDIELKDVLSGSSKNISIPKREKCSKCSGNGFTEYKACATCHGNGKTAIKQSPFNIWMQCGSCQGTGRAGTLACNDCKSQGFINVGEIPILITIPKGIETGHQLRVAGYGEPSKYTNGKNGDLVIIIIVKEHRLFKRHGVNLTYEFPIGFSELSLGCNLDIQTLEGTAVVTIPSNTQDYTQFRLKGMGLPYFHGGKGDLIIILKMFMPSLNTINSNKELFEKLSQIEKVYLEDEREKLNGK